jgi:hypothetical protein
VEEFVSVIDGSFFEQRKFNTFLAYGQVKYLGALWMSALARKHPGLRLLTVSPGNTAGTEALRDMGLLTRTLMNHLMLPYALPALGSDTSWRRAPSGWSMESPTNSCAAACFTPADRAPSPGPSWISRRSSPTSVTPHYNSMPTKPFIASRRSHAHTENRLIALSVRMARRLVPLKKGCHDKRRYHHPARSSIPVVPQLHDASMSGPLDHDTPLLCW